MSSLVEKHGIVLRNTICILGNKFCRTLFRPPGRRGLSFSAAQAGDLNCGQGTRELPASVCFRHFSPNSLFRLSPSFAYLLSCLYFWAAVSSWCSKSGDKQAEAAQECQNQRISEISDDLMNKTSIQNFKQLVRPLLPHLNQFSGYKFPEFNFFICIFLQPVFLAPFKTTGGKLDENSLPANYGISWKTPRRKLTRVDSENLRWNPKWFCITLVRRLLRPRDFDPIHRRSEIYSHRFPSRCLQPPLQVLPCAF